MDTLGSLFNAILPEHQKIKTQTQDKQHSENFTEYQI